MLFLAHLSRKSYSRGRVVAEREKNLCLKPVKNEDNKIKASYINIINYLFNIQANVDLIRILVFDARQQVISTRF